MNSAEERKWIRPASMFDSFLEYHQRNGRVLTSYWLTLRTVVPLQGSLVREALLHLYRKVPTLRVCLPERNGERFWWRQMDSEEIDFRVLEEADPLETLETTAERRYDSSKGPMWCATFIPTPDPNCPMPELHLNFPHCSSLILGNHHAIADGTTNMRVVNMFLQILDDVIAGKTIDDDEQLGDHATHEEITKLLDAKKSELEQDPELLARMLERTKETERSLLFLKAYPPPQDKAKKNLVIPYVLDKETTERFLSRCKTEGITVNSGFVSLINVSIVDMLQKGGVKQDVYWLKELHFINLRRYMSGNTERTLGPQVGVFHLRIRTPAKWKDDFWRYARELHQHFHRELEEQGPIRETCLDLMDVPQDSIETYFAETLLPSEDYESSNMGNIDKIITASGDHVRMSQLVRTTSCYRNFISHMFQTYRGHFSYSLTYNPCYITDHSARELVDRMFTNLESVC